MRFDILGAGSLGLLWAARLADAGHPVRLLVRNREAIERWHAAGSRLTLEHAGVRRQIGIEIAHVAELDSLDCLIVATKAYAVEQALAPLTHLLGPESSLVLLQNGLGSQQRAEQLCPQGRILYASVTDGAWKPAPFHVVWAGQGTTRIGDANGGGCPGWLQALSPEALDWVWEPDITQVLWQKLAVNCAINPFTVLHDCQNGDVPALAGAQLAVLISELQALLTSQHCASQAARLPGTVAEVIRNTAANSSSMRQDVHAGRRTEIDYILGHACRTAASERLHTPVMTGLYDALKTHLAMHGLPTD